MDKNDVPINRNAIKKSEVPNDEVKNKNETKSNDFVSAFPEWDLKPPVVVVKRVRRGI